MVQTWGVGLNKHTFRDTGMYTYTCTYADTYGNTTTTRQYMQPLNWIRTESVNAQIHIEATVANSMPPTRKQDIGQVTEVGLSCYLVLLSYTRGEIVESSLPKTFSFQLRLLILLGCLVDDKWMRIIMNLLTLLLIAITKWTTLPRMNSPQLQKSASTRANP